MIELEDVKEYYDAPGHTIGHVRRVTTNALKIAETEECDKEVVKAAALLHDIARGLDITNPQGPCHAEKGAEMAKEILKKHEYSEEQVKNIIHCIRVHRYSSGLKPETIEAGILQDADRLDALGAVIIARLFYHRGQTNGVIHDPSIPPQEYKGAVHTSTAINHFYEKLLKIKPETFNTKKGREMAENRYEFTKAFLEQFLKEWNFEV
jgi:uncharacterized protein